MEITNAAFKEVPADAFGLVIRGCAVDTQENRDGFINGVVNYLAEQGVIPQGTTPDQLLEKVLLCTTPIQYRYGKGEVGGRNDLVFIFKTKDYVPVHMGRFAVVRLGMPDTSWIEDWLNNDARFYNETPRGPHARHDFDIDD